MAALLMLHQAWHVACQPMTGRPYVASIQVARFRTLAQDVPAGPSTKGDQTGMSPPPTPGQESSMKTFISPTAIAALCGVLPNGERKPRKKTSESICNPVGKGKQATKSSHQKPADATNRKGTASGGSVAR
jgi:hypothetical protein